MRAHHIPGTIRRLPIFLSALAKFALMISSCAVVAASELSLAEFEEIAASPDSLVIDARPTDEFNGWAPEGLPEGGHIPGAVDFDARWLDLELENRTEQLKKVLATKGVNPEKRIVVYSFRQVERQRVTDYLKSIGIESVSGFDLALWINQGRKLRRYPGYHRIVPPRIVKRLIDGETPETFERAKRIKFVEVSWGDEKASYEKGHLPGSFHVNTDHFEPPPSWYLSEPQKLRQFATDYGFESDDTVVISSEDVTASYRLYVVLQHIGIGDVRVMNGGVAAWKRAGYSLETKRHQPLRRKPFLDEVDHRPEIILTTDQVKARLAKSASFRLVDTRTWNEFVGITSGYKTHEHKGRIPGSVYGQASFRGANSLTPYRNLDGTMRNANEIIGLWKRSGLTVEQELCFMCGGGWRAAEVFAFGQVMGLRKISLYSDGWIGWSNNRENPRETGSP